MSGKRHRQKGDRYEREIVNTLQDEGIGAERVPLSGAAGGSFAHDVTVPVLGEDWKAQCKHYGATRGFNLLYDWIWGNRVLFLKKDRQRTLVVMHFDDFAKLARLPIDFPERSEGPSEPSPKRASA